MDIVAIPTPLQGNPLHPLPSDYRELSVEGQRKARVNACRQWLMPRRRVADLVSLPASTPLPALEGAVNAYRSEALVSSLRFFDLYYLHPDPASGFDPLFYDDDPVPTPQFHWDFVRAVAVEAAVIEVAPRGSAKSFKERKLSCLRTITRPIYKILYCTSSDKVAVDNAQAVRQQCYTNSRIQDDWSCEPEFGGRIKPNRGDAPTGIEEFALSNGSSFATYSVSSRMRGKRPRRFVLDDPEYDPTASTSMAVIREYMRRLLLKIALPMVMRRECGIEWLATFVSKRHFAYQAMMVREIMEEGRKTLRAEIAEFDYWHRILVRAATEGPDGKLVSCWPHMWPVDEAQKKELSLPKDTRSLEEIRVRIGAANFNSEYMAKPGESDDSYFVATPEKHGYTLEGADEMLGTKPCLSSAIVTYTTFTKNGPEKRSCSLHSLCKSARLFMTADTSKTAKQGSDFKVCALMAVTPDNDLFVLDIWGARCKPEVFVREIFRMADRWLCPSVWPELIDDGLTLRDSLQSLVATRARDELGVQHLPAIKGFNPGQADKTSKISGLYIRFEHGKIKFPLWRRNDPHWRPLFDQIEGFNPDAEDGGLSNDDHLDTVSMSQFVIKGRVARGKPDPAQAQSALQRLLEGEVHDEQGTPLAYYVDFSTLSVEDFGKVMNMARQRTAKGSESKV